jgi:hypothetical protein
LIRWRSISLVLDEVAEVRVLALADRAVERDRVTRDLHHAPRLLDRHLRLDGDLLDRGLAAELLEQRLLDVAQLGHRLDHVDRDADRARVIGDRARDRLADPPGRVRRELVASLVLVLVDGAHEARVAFLDDVEEGEPAVAVLLGDRHHEAEVAAREIALRLLVLAEHALDVAHAALELVHRLEHEVAEAVELLLHHVHVLGVVPIRVLLGLLQVALHLAHLRDDAEELAVERDDAARTQAALLEEGADATSPQRDLALQLRALACRHAAGLELLPGLEVELQQALDGGEVCRDALLDLLLRMRLGSRDSHGAVERQLLGMHVLQDLDGFASRVVALEHLPAEDHARRLDLLRQPDLLFTREQGDRAHLREVHADGIVDALRALLGERLLDRRLHLAVIEDVLLDVEIVGIGTVLLAAGLALGSLLLALVLLDLELGRSQRRSGRLRGTARRIAAARLLRVVPLELQVRLQRRVEADVVVAPDLDLVHHLDRVLAHEDKQLVDLLGIDELVGQARVELLVADPATADAVLDQLAKHRGCEIKGFECDAHL